MPDPTDFSQIAQMGQDERGDGGAPGLAQLQESLSKMRDTQSRLVVANQQNEQVLPPQSIQVNTAKGTVTMKDLPIATYESYNRDRQQLNEIRGAFHQQAEQLQKQEQQARSQPAWVQLATALSANLASQKDMPGWVRGLGQTAAQMNPRPEQIQAQRMGVLGEEAQLTEKALGSDVTAMKMQADTKQAELARKTAEGTDKKAADYLNRTRIAVRGGAGTPLSYEAFQSGAVASGVDPERIPGLYRAHIEEANLAAAGKEADVGRKAKLMTFGEALGEQRDVKKGEISKRNRLSEIQTAFENSISPTKEGFQLKLYEQKKAIDEAAAGRKEVAVLGPRGQTELKQASATNQYLGTVEHMLEQPEFAEVQGPLFQFNPKTNEFALNPQAVLPKQFKGIDRTVVESQISHEIPRLLTLLLNGQAGGASILRTDVGKKLVSDMGITGAVRPDQALAILKIVRDSNNNNVAATMRSRASANWPAMRDLVGANDPRNAYYFKDKKDAFGGPLTQFPSLDKREGGETKKPETTPEKKYPWEQ
jgi:hypothetical protein